MALDAVSFMRARVRGTPSWPGHDPETGYVGADRLDHSQKLLADGAGHTFFDGTPVPLRNLPASWKALYYLAAKVNNITAIEKMIAVHKITPLSTESDLKKLDELRLVKGKPKSASAAP